MKASKIKQMKREYVNETFHHWVFRVLGSDGNVHRWSNYTLSENASKDDIVESIKAYMTGSLTYRATETSPISAISCSHAIDGLDDLLT